MRYILWAQNESTDKPPTIIVDDQVLTAAEDQEQAYAVICEKNEDMCMSPELREVVYNGREELYSKLLKDYKSFNSPEFTMSSNYNFDDEGFYIQGCYIDKDVRGRVMPFMFYAYGVASIKEAQDLLQKASSIIGRTCNTFELAVLKYLYDKKKHKLASNSKKKIVIALAILLIIIISLLSLNGK